MTHTWTITGVKYAKAYAGIVVDMNIVALGRVKTLLLKDLVVNSQCPEFPVFEMMEELRPGERIWNGIVSVELDPSHDECSLFVGQETLFLSFVREVNYDEPCDAGNNHCH
jgi:hypothetical protein